MNETTGLMKLDDEMLTAVSGGCGHHGKGKGKGKHRGGLRQKVDQSFTSGDITINFGSGNTLTDVDIFIGNQATVSA